MDKEPTIRGTTSFSRKVGVEETRKLKAQRRGVQNVWFGFGMFGLIRWSVAVPTLIGAILGHWLDKHHPGTHSWTLALLVAGLVIGCLNAWHWVARENKHIHDETGERDE